MDSSSKKTKRCIGCSESTIEISQVRPSNSKSFQETYSELSCSKCGRFLCSNCIQSFHLSIESKVHDIHDDCMHFINGIREFCKTSGKSLYSNYIGHCCIVSMYYDRKKRKINTIPGVNATSFNNVSESYISGVGGCLVLSEYNLIISHDESAMDVIGLGRDINFDPSWQFVVDEVNASYLRSCGVEPIRSIPDSWNISRHTITVVQPYSLND